MSEQHFITAAGLFDTWADDVLHGKPPVIWNVGAGFQHVELGPGLVCLLGGAPGSGKTALSMQWVVDALRSEKTLRCLVCNVEMHPRTLMDRQLARLSGVNAGDIRYRRVQVHDWRIRPALDELHGLSDRLAYHTGPPTLKAVAESADAFKPGLVVLDYVQRFGVGTGAPLSQREELDSIMGHLRQFTDEGLGVLAVSAVGRQRGKTGSDYAGLGLASFRGTSELEYGADSCWIIEPMTVKDAPKTVPALIRSSCVKNRHGETPGMLLDFDKPRQSFKVNPGTALPWGDDDGGKDTPMKRGRAVSAVPDVGDLGGDQYQEGDDDELF
ncbi:MAG: AAA family ATPase [Candidatus Hydrogenedens sp.]|nr:AAA family ATPase [Candidatus Hydrogenedens sp.]